MLNLKKISVILLSLTFFITSFSTGNDNNPHRNESNPLVDMDVFFNYIPFPENNPYDSNIARLGGKLFFDPILSSNNKISCATCHKPEFAFADTVAFNSGVLNIPLKKNSMSLVNLAWNTHFFWDGRINTIEEQIIHPITEPTEMGLKKEQIPFILTQDSMYCNQFKQFLQTDHIDYTYVSKAIGQFLRTIVSANNGFDKKIQSLQMDHPNDLFDATFYGLSSNLKETFRLCAECHNSVFYGGEFMKNNGLDSVPEPGYYNSTKDPKDIGSFKVPILRNVALTPPYMHDGRFKTLREVVEHYNSGIKFSPTLDPLLIKDGTALKLHLSETEIDEVVKFLESMTDTAFIDRWKHTQKHYD